jgi:DNA polymerase-3 subunit delta
MQIKRLGEIESFLKAPGKNIEGALIYGRDQGLVRERSKALEAAILGANPDPFRLVELSEAEAKDAPGALYAEAASISMMGGRKFIRLRMSSDAAARALEAYLSERESGAARPDAFFVIEAGELRATAGVRKTAEAAAMIAAIACYPDDEASLESLVETVLREAHAEINPDAKIALLERLGSDRGVSRQELDKLITYCGPAPGGRVKIELQDVLALIGDTGAAEVDSLIDAVLSGQPEAAARQNGRLAAAGIHPVRILRALGLHLERLANLESGKGGFGYYQAEALRRHAARWPARNVARAQSLVLDAEMQCKTTGLPAEEISERALLALARGARDAPPA